MQREIDAIGSCSSGRSRRLFRRICTHVIMLLVFLNFAIFVELCKLHFFDLLHTSESCVSHCSRIILCLAFLSCQKPINFKSFLFFKSVNETNPKFVKLIEFDAALLNDFLTRQICAAACLFCEKIFAKRAPPLKISWRFRPNDVLLQL